MMRADALDSHVYPVRTEMTGTKQIFILHVWSTNKRESKEFLLDEHLSQVCSTDEDESRGITVDESSAEESKSECVHKNINK